MPETREHRRRGPQPNPDRGAPCGYRITDRQRFELVMAQSFLGTRVLQQTIDVAVRELLDRLHSVRGFTDALVNAEAHQRELAGVPTLTPQDRQ